MDTLVVFGQSSGMIEPFSPRPILGSRTLVSATPLRLRPRARRAPRTLGARRRRSPRAAALTVAIDGSCRSPAPPKRTRRSKPARPRGRSCSTVAEARADHGVLGSSPRSARSWFVLIRVVGRLWWRGGVGGSLACGTAVRLESLGAAGCVRSRGVCGGTRVVSQASPQASSGKGPTHTASRSCRGATQAPTSPPSS